MRLASLMSAVFTIALSTAIATGGVAAAEQAKGGLALAAHRAVYEFVLSSSRPASTVSALTGRMVYEFQGSKCDGYTQSMRFVTLSTAQNGGTTLADQRSTTWEDAAGTKLKFQSSQYRDRKLAEKTAGSAERGAKGTDIAVRITEPNEDKTGIGAASLYPVQHSINLLAAARSGAKTFTADFYDGSEGGAKSYRVTAFIGRRKAPGYNRKLDRIVDGAALDRVAAWPVALSYFEHGSDKKDAVPVYEMSFLFFENGITRNLMIDNGDYAIKGKLTKLELLDSMPCRE